MTVKTLERLQYLHSLIKKENTGTPDEIAFRMNISKRMVFNLIENLREFDASIIYDRHRKTYYYESEFSLQINLTITVKTCEGKTDLLGYNYFATN